MFFNDLTTLRRTALRFLLYNLALSLVLSILFIPPSLREGGHFIRNYCWTFVITISIWTGCILISQYLSRKISWTRYPIKRAIVGVITIIGYSLIISIFDKYLLCLLTYGKLPENNLEFIKSTGLVTIISSLVLSLIYTAAGFFRNWKQEIIQSEQLKTQMINYQYEVLRNQINPHFLFNSLNVLTELIDENKELAIDFVRQLSDLFHYMLNIRDKELVKLTDELEMVNAYLKLLKIRFENKLEVTLSIPSPQEWTIVPMTLQQLIENAVKHNEISSAHPLSIQIIQQNDRLKVTNPVRLKTNGVRSHKTGLKNIINQYALFSEQSIQIEQTEKLFSVEIPLLKTE